MRKFVRDVLPWLLIIGIIIAILIYCAEPAHSANLLYNPSFEWGKATSWPGYNVADGWRVGQWLTGDDHWTRNTFGYNRIWSGHVEWVQQHVHNGTYALTRSHLYSPIYPGEQTAEVGAWIDYLEPIPAGTWDFSMFVYVEKVGDFEESEVWIDDGHWGKKWTVPYDTWTLVGGVYSSTSPMTFSFTWLSGFGKMYIDDAFVGALPDPLPEPGGIVSLALGLAITAGSCRIWRNGWKRRYDH